MLTVGLCAPAQLDALLTELSPDAVACDVSSALADVTVVEQLARLALIARRHGCDLHTRGASADLRELLALAGLLDAVHAA